MLPAGRGESEPTGREHTQHVPMCEQRDITLDRSRPRNHPIHPLSRLVGPLATRAPIAKDQPVRKDFMDLPGRQALVLSVIPLDQVVINNGLAAETRQLAGLSCPLHGTDENECEGLLGQRGP